MSYTNGLDDPTAYFQTKTYSGNGVETAITNDGNSNLQPDLIWFKARSAAYYHGLFDVIRGTELRLSTNVTDAESSKPSAFTSFDSNGFTVGADVSNTTNTSGQTFVAWQWKANGAGVSNTDGSITSTVSANTTSGFSIVTRTGTGANASVGHGLGVAPSMIITKVYSTAGNDWMVYHKSLGATNYIKLNLTDGTFASSAVWNNTAPDSDKFYLGSSGDANASGQTSVAYCFADVKGFSKFGSYIGNGSTSSGTFIYTGFKPAFVMVKNTTNGSTYWVMVDSVRKPANPANANLYANDAEAEGATDYLYLFSNGFSPLKSASSWVNESDSTYIYMAFAENPFVTSTSIPTTAR
jgi:hypothetical protein